MTNTKKIETFIDQSEDNIFDATKIYYDYFSDLNQQTFHKILQRLSKSGTLINVSKGLYLKSGLTNVTSVRNEVVDYFTSNNRGLLYNETNKHIIFTNHTVKKNRNILDYKVYYVNLPFTKEVSTILKILLIIRDANKIDLSKLLSNDFSIEMVSTSYSDCDFNSIQSELTFSRSVVNAFKEFLNINNIGHNIN